MEKKSYLFEKKALVAQAIGHPLRVAILDFLRDGPQCVCDIARYIGSERSNVSRHLALMVRSGVLSFEKQGLKVIYRVKTPCVFRFLDCLTDCLREQITADQKLLNYLQ